MRVSRHLLLIAEPLLAEGLARLIQEAFPQDRVGSDPAAVSGALALVIWCPPATISAEALARETQHLGQLWEPAPLLLVLPPQLALTPEQLLNLPAAGLLQSNTSEALISSITTVLEGGRVVQVCGAETAIGAGVPRPQPLPAAPLGLGQWLLVSGLQQIDQELQRCEWLLHSAVGSGLRMMMVQGRRRELRAARQLLLWLWGPISLAWSDPLVSAPQANAGGLSLNLSLSQRNAEGSWQAIRERLQQRIREGLANHSGQLLALEALQPERRADLLLALLDQLQTLRGQLLNSPLQPRELAAQWLNLQVELRQQALRRMASPYVRLPLNGELQAVAETLIRECQLELSDPEMPDPQAMLQTLVLGQPLLIEGQLLAPDAPLAVLHLEKLLANWVLRTAEQVSAQVLACCAAWPELRRYLLLSPLLSTRSLERLRNQLNAQQRWSNWLKRPVLIYESRRQLFTIDVDGIGCVELTEPRDPELGQLGWSQQLVTLALESRDALAPQLHSLIQAIGRLVVIVLTQVVGRAIGLVGRGIVQGMGRGLQRS